MMKQQRIFLPLLGLGLGLVLTSGCASTGFKASLLEMPDKAPSSVVIELEGDDPDLSQSFAETLGDLLKKSGVNPGSGRPSGPSAIIRVGAKKTTYVYDFYSHSNGTGEFVSNVNRLLANITLLKGSEGSKPYLSMGLSLNGAVLGVSVDGSTGSSIYSYQGLESVDSLKVKAARLVSALYLNALGGDPEPLEGEWMEAGGDAEVVFHKGQDARPDSKWSTGIERAAGC